MTNKGFIDIHILQTVPPSNMNRDDTGSPKTARFGGAVRSRVSSQAWKHAVRNLFPSMLDADFIGERTKDIVGCVADQIVELSPDTEMASARVLGQRMLEAAGLKPDKDGNVKALFFMAPLQARKLAQLAIDSQKDGKNLSAEAKKQAEETLKVKENPTLNAVDIALFGRMVANISEFNVDAAVQVAHALSVNQAEPEFDYYTGLDERSPNDKARAVMIDTIEYTSSTLYRYANVNIQRLYDNLGDVQVTRKAIEAFLIAFSTSMPTGKQNTFANRTLPDVVVIQIRDTQPVNLVNAFEVPVKALGAKAISVIACERLVAREIELDEAFGVAPLETYVVCAGEGREPLGSLAGAKLLSLSDAASEVGTYATRLIEGM